MNCPVCKTPIAPGAAQCPACRTWVTAYTAPPQQTQPQWQQPPLRPVVPVYQPVQQVVYKAPPKPLWQDEPVKKQEESVPQEAPLSTKQCLLLLIVGLLPLVGIAYCLFIGFGAGRPPQSRNIARALLCLHAVVLCLCLAGLCVWVLTLAGQVGG